MALLVLLLGLVAGASSASGGRRPASRVGLRPPRRGRPGASRARAGVQSFFSRSWRGALPRPRGACSSSSFLTKNSSRTSSTRRRWSVVTAGLASSVSMSRGARIRATWLVTMSSRCRSAAAATAIRVVRRAVSRLVTIAASARPSCAGCGGRRSRAAPACRPVPGEEAGERRVGRCRRWSPRAPPRSPGRGRRGMREEDVEQLLRRDRQGAAGRGQLDRAGAVPASRRWTMRVVGAELARRIRTSRWLSLSRPRTR